MSSKDINEHLAESFLEYVSERGSNSNSTQSSYRTSIKVFREFIEETDLRIVTSATILRFRDNMVRLGYRSSTFKLRFTVLRLFYEWLMDDGMIANSPYPKMISWNASPPKAIVVPSPRDIVKVRTRAIGFNASEAALSELMWSSGLRIGEVKQIRACDIDFSRIPIDVSTGKQSAYCGGQITLNENSLVLKGSSRVTYMSKAAARMIKILMEKNGVSEGSRMPIFPYSTSGLEWQIRKVADLIYKPDSEEVQYQQTERSPEFSDIDLSKVDLNPKMKVLIKRRMEKAKQDEDKQKIKPKKVFANTAASRMLHPHSLRHFFTCLMYFRSYHGTEGDMVRLRQMLGHSDDNVTMVYLTELNVVTNLREWKVMMLGKNLDWIGIK